MSDSIPPTSPASESRSFGLSALTLAYLLLRAWLAMRALFTGVDKFAGRTTVQVPLLDEFGNPDINGTMVAVERKVYGFSHYQGLPSSMRIKFSAEPLLPDWLVTPYAAALGPVLIVLGLFLLLGLFSRWTLFAMGLVYVSLSFGLVLINESAGVAWLGVHLLMIVAALFLADHDRFCLTRRG